MTNNKKCIICGKIIKDKRNKGYCSRKCYAEARQNYAICVICGKRFKHSPSDISTKTCGNSECTKAYKKANTPPDRINKAHENLKTNPKTGHFETHHSAEHWDLIAPDGTEYSFSNLVLFADEHPDILPVCLKTGKQVKPNSFVRGIYRLKGTKNGTEKNASLHNDYWGWNIKETKETKPE